MLRDNWYIIDNFSYMDYLQIANILNAFLDSERRRIFFSFHFFDLDDLDDYVYNPDDCEDEVNYSREDCINEDFRDFKVKLISTVNYDDLTNKVKDMLCSEYIRLYQNCDEAVKEDLYNKFLDDKIDCLDEMFIHSVKEVISREMSKMSKEKVDFIEQRKVFENSVDVSFEKNRFNYEPNRKKLNYVWFEPISRDDLIETVKEFRMLLRGIITEDISEFDNYLYAFEFFEEREFSLAINDRVGNFETQILPKIKTLLRKENIVYSEKEFFNTFGRSYPF